MNHSETQQSMNIAWYLISTLSLKKCLNAPLPYSWEMFQSVHIPILSFLKTDCWFTCSYVSLRNQKYISNPLIYLSICIFYVIQLTYSSFDKYRAYISITCYSHTQIGYVNACTLIAFKTYYKIAKICVNLTHWPLGDLNETLDKLF